MKHKWILSLPMLFNNSSRKGLCSLVSSKFLLTKSSTLPFSAHQVSFGSSSFMLHLQRSSLCLNLQALRHYSNSSNIDDFVDIMYEELTVESFRELIRNDDDEKLIQDILSLYEYQKFDNGEIPSKIKVNQMAELMKMPREVWQKRFKSLKDKELFIKYKKKIKSSQPKSLVYCELQKIVDKGISPTMGLKFDPLTGAPIYGEWLNSHFTRLRQLEYRCSFNPNLLAACLYGQEILIDCDYEYTIGDAKKVIFDLQRAISINRCAPSPFNITITGLKNAMLKGLFYQHKKECLSGLTPSLNIYEQSFIELYKDQKLIYLTPHADKELCEYDHDALYIIGGLPIRSMAPVSLKKANSLGLPNYRFPLSFLPFRAMRGAKSLEIPECVSILLHFKEFGDIKEAVTHGIHIHRLKSLEELEQEQKIRFEKKLKIERRLARSVKR